MTNGLATPTLRRAALPDAPGILRVLEAAFEQWPAFEAGAPPLQHLRWKMREVDGLAPFHSVGLVEGEIAAVVLRWARRFWLDGREYVGSGAVDVAIDPARQGRGLGGAIAAYSAEAANSYTAFGFGTGTNNPAMAHIYAQLGQTAEVEHPLRVWVRAFDPRTFLGTHLRGGSPTHFSRVAAGVARQRLRRPQKQSRAAAQTLERFDAATDALWEAARDMFDLIGTRRASFLNWRFVEEGGGRSEIRAVLDGAEVLGYVVVKRSGGWANIVDFLVAPDEKSVGEILFLDVCERQRAAGVRGVRCWLPVDHPQEPALARAGFQPVREEAQAGFWRQGEPSVMGRLCDPALRVHLTHGDYDFI